MGGPCCSYPTGVEKGISEPSLSLFNPQYYPTTNYHSRGGDERKRARQFLRSALTTKSTKADWVWWQVGKDGLGFWCIPSFASVFFHHLLAQTPKQMGTIQTIFTNTNQLCNETLLIKGREENNLIQHSSTKLMLAIFSIKTYI